MPSSSEVATPVKTRNDIAFAGGDGAELLGDLYMPDGVESAPVLVAVHGGGWQIGSRKFYVHWDLISPSTASRSLRSNTG